MSRNEIDRNAAEGPQRQRIAKLMARVGLCSRREAEAWILAGRVSVNGTVLTSPAVDVAPDDNVVVDGAPLPAAEKTRLFLFHKPRGLVTSDRDPEGRPTVAGFLRDHWPDGPRVVTVGRLDINTEGLLLLTNDGGLARLLELPQTGWVRRYRVRAKGVADVATLDALAEGVTIDGIDYAGIEAKLDRTQGANCWLTMGLREGKNREIKRVLEHIGLEVNRLIRLSFGPFQLLDLPEGAVEEVRTRVLRDQLGESLAARAGVDFGDAPASTPEPNRDRDVRRRPEGQPRSERREAHGERAPRRPDARRTDTSTGSRRQDRRQNRHEDRHEDRRPGRRDGDRDAPPPKRERPAGGTRKHVSTLRAAEAETAKRGPRKRIERSDATVRGDRTVTVERLVSTRPEAPTGARRRPVRDDMASAELPQRGRPRRGDEAADPSDPRRVRADARGRGAHASPSALGKRERIARSGGDGRQERPRAERQKRPGQNRPHENQPDRGRRDPRRQEKSRGDRSEGGRDDRPARTRPTQDKRSPSTRDGGARRAASNSTDERRERRGKSASGADRPSKAGGRGPAGRPSAKPPGRGSPGGRPRGPSKPKR